MTFDFVWRMEDILDLYAAPADPRHPRVCFDELACGLIGDVYAPWPARPGRPARYDYEYQRHGSANLLMAFDPDRGWRWPRVTAQRRRQEFAWFVRDLVELHYPSAEQIHLVLDNLNTHTASSFYATFDPSTANELMHRVVFHHTPVHASWLNMIEIEFSVLGRQCLKQRLASLDAMTREVTAWAERRNAAQATVNWRFTTGVAREKLHRMYDTSLM